MKLNLINVDEFCKDLPEITSHKILESGKFSSTGLFSQQIFGPIKSFCCACNKMTYRGRTNNASICQDCGVEITSSEERRKRFAKITLPFAILNPIFYYMIIKCKPSVKMILNHLLAYTEEYYINEEDLLVKVVDKSILPEDVVKFSGVMGAKSLIKKIIDENPEKPESTFLNNNMDSILIENVVVVPPDFRPCGTTETGTKVIDDVNKFYIRLVTQSNHLKNSLLSIEKCDDIYKDNFKYIQFLVISLYDYILEKMSKKTGLIRSNILGKRVDFSGRAVISPNPDLNLDECNIPYMMLLELLKPQLSSYLIKRRVCKRYNQAVKIIEDCIKEESDELYELAKEFCKGKVCVLNRQPTLHRMGILGFKMGIHLGKTIQIHPLVCPPLNADFDGDAVAVYVPVTEESKQDIIDKIGVWNNLISPTDCTLLTSPNQDIILGIHSLTK